MSGWIGLFVVSLCGMMMVPNIIKSLWAKRGLSPVPILKFLIAVMAICAFGVLSGFVAGHAAKPIIIEKDALGLFMVLVTLAGSVCASVLLERIQNYYWPPIY